MASAEGVGAAAIPLPGEGVSRTFETGTVGEGWAAVELVEPDPQAVTTSRVSPTT